MQRFLLLATAIVWFIAPAAAQDRPPSQPAQSPVLDDVVVERTLARPAERLAGNNTEVQDLLQEVEAETYGLLSDSLTEDQVLRRLSRLYQHQSDILAAQAEDDSEHAERLLELAMTELGALFLQPDITDRPRFRELYRTIVTEYERYYGVSDTLLFLPRGDIFDLRADMFAALDDVDEPLLEDVMLPDLVPMETVIPMTMNRLVQRSIDFLLRERRDKIQVWMSRADTYFPMMEQIFQEVGVPDELKYLAVIESGLNPKAKSWASAVGMWQFIAATGRAYDLQVTSWADERMDPEKATWAAARHLKDLYEMYGHDWQVAIAGYNCSPRCIRRANQRAGGTTDNPATFWEMYPYLPSETRGYVPIFIAASLVMSNPGAFGLTQEQQGPRYAFDLVPVQGMLSLDDVAAMAGTDVATIKALNPELQRSSLPPSQAPYTVRIPMGSYAQFANAFEALPDEEKRPVGEYVVRRGDSLGKIANRYGLTVRALKAANGLRSNTIHPGQIMVVPVPNYARTVTLANATPVSVQYGTRSVRPIEPLGTPTQTSTPVVQASTTVPSTTTSPSAPTPEPTPAPPAEEEKPTETRIVYKVRRGDSLGAIAEKYSVSVRDIQQWNNLRGTTIRIGQDLYLYSSGQTQPETVVHTVRRGDNLTEIAKRYGVTISSVRSWNNLRSSTIHPGQELTIHPGQSAPNYSIYLVRRGDNLGKIAQSHSTTVSKLKEWNSLQSNTIRPGQRLRIYE